VTDTGFDEFVRARGRQLRRTACLLTGNVPDADDLVQAALVKVYPRWTAIEQRGDPFAYVLAVLVNTRRTAWHRQGRHESAVATLPELATADVYARSDTHRVLWDALLRLPRRQRATIVLRYYEDFPEADVARILGCSRGTVKSQTAKAMTTLRGLVDGELHPSGRPLEETS